MGPSGFPVVIESQAIMVSIRVAIGKLIHALEVWSDDPRLPNIEPLQHEPSTADSTAIQRCIGQYIYIALCPRVVVLYCNIATIQRLHSTALQRSTLYSALQSPSAIGLGHGSVADSRSALRSLWWRVEDTNSRLSVKVLSA